MHCLGEGWDVSHSVCSLCFVPHFGTWDLGNAGTWPRGSQVRFTEFWGQLHQLPAAMHRSGLLSGYYDGKS